MNSQKILLIIIAIITIFMFGFIVYDQYTKGNIGGRSDNWQWSDKWPKSNREIKEKVSNNKEDKDVQQISSIDYVEALKLSKEKNMKVVLFFNASWCKWCKKMENESFNNEKAKDALKKYIFAEIDTDTNGSIVSKYNVNGIPAIFIVDNEGKVIKKENYMDSKKFAEWLK